jgi:ADP-ribosylglycohydrolase
MDYPDIKRLADKLLNHQWFFIRKETNAITDDTQLIHLLAKLVVKQAIEIRDLHVRLEKEEGEE